MPGLALHDRTHLIGVWVQKVDIHPAICAWAIGTRLQTDGRKVAFHKVFEPFPFQLGEELLCETLGLGREVERRGIGPCDGGFRKFEDMTATLAAYSVAGDGRRGGQNDFA